MRVRYWPYLFRCRRLARTPISKHSITRAKIDNKNCNPDAQIRKTSPSDRPARDLPRNQASNYLKHRRVHCTADCGPVTLCRNALENMNKKLTGFSCVSPEPGPGTRPGPRAAIRASQRSPCIVLKLQLL